MSFPGRILSSSSIFKPALAYLQNLDPTSQNAHRPSTPTVTNLEDDDDIDASSPFHSNNAAMPALRPYHSRDSSGELEPGIPLVDYSRTPSPSRYKTSRPRSATQSEDEDDNVPLSLRPLVPGEVEVGVDSRGWWRQLTKSDSFGGFLFGTWVGWQIYVGLLVIWSFGVAFTLLLMNRFILWSKCCRIASQVILEGPC